MKSPSKIGRYIYERDEYGYITRKMYARHNGDNDDISLDDNGISGFEYERDSLHRVVRTRFLNNNYDYKSNNVGVAGKRYEYDENGNLCVAEYVDKEGNLKYNEFHWAKSVDTYDDYGFCLEERVYGTDGNPCISAQGYHRLAVSINKNSETISYYDIHNNPTYSLPLGGDAGGYSITTYIKNKKGQIIEVLFLDSQGNLFYNQHHIAKTRIEYDNNGLVTDVRNYGIDDEPCTNSFGFFHQHMSYNHKGEMNEISYYNVNEKPAQNIIGIYKINVIYDYSGYRVKEAHAYNMESLPVNCPLFNGAAWVRFGYRGSSKCVSEISFFGIDNQPIETNVGVRVDCERNARGQITTYRYYNEDNKLCANINHCAIMKVDHNEMGMVTNRSFYDENDNPTTYNGVFRTSFNYTTTGQVERICMYDTLQQLQNGPEGWAILEFEYKNGAMKSKSVFGKDGERVEVLGVHKYLYEIDDCGYVLSQSAYDKELRPTTNTQLGAHKVVNLYDENRRNIGRDYYNAINTEPFVCIRQKLSQRGMPTELASYNAQMELIESPFNSGVAMIKTEYDSQDRSTHICATNRKGKKMNTSYGFAEAFYSFDNDAIEYVFLDSERKIVNNNSLADPVAYSIQYMTETGQRIFGKTIKWSYNKELETIRDAYCYDSQNQHILKAIRCEDWRVQIFDASEKRSIVFLSLEDEYNEYVHIVDSIQNDMENKYGKPKYNKYVLNK